MLRRQSKWRTLAGVATVAALAVSACGDDDDSEAATQVEPPASTAGSETSTAGGASGSDVSVGMALPGPQNDVGFNEAHYRGIVKAEEELGITANVQENIHDPAARIDALRNLAADNELVIGVGAEFAEAGLTIAPQFPDVQFMVINGQLDPAIPNLHVYGVRQGVPAYIAGVLAASWAEPEVTSVGFVGGEEIPPTTQSDDGFKAGIESVDPSIEYATTIVGNFNDAPKGKDATAAQIASGAQLIFGLLDAGFPGAIQAAEEAGGETLLFSVIFPRCADYENLVGTAVLNSDALVTSMVSDFLEGTIPTEARYYGVEDPNIQRLELCPGFDTPENQQIVDDTTQQINDGEITLPDGV